MASKEKRKELIEEIKGFLVEQKKYSLLSINKDEDVIRFMKPSNHEIVSNQYINCNVYIHEEEIVLELFTSDIKPGISIRTGLFRFKDPNFSLYEAQLSLFLKTCLSI